MSEPENKKERKEYFRKLFYQKWGNYQDYLSQKKPKQKFKNYLKIIVIQNTLNFYTNLI